MRQHERQDRIPDDKLGEWIRKLPYPEPGPDLTRRIMSGLEPKKLGWFQRLYLKVRTPVTVSVSPLYAATAVLLLCITGGVFYYQLGGYGFTIQNGPRNANGVPVVFHFKDSAARTVALIGTFNNWDPDGYEMIHDPGTGNWMIQIRLAPGKHDYVFWVDGEKAAPDPNADLIREDDFGTRNSVLFVKGNHGQAI